MKNKNVIIMGAGLSGLACAYHLNHMGIPFQLFEKAAEPGGRVQSYKNKYGHIRDVGFQVLLSSYPELNKILDLESLNLKRFNSGALIAVREDHKIKKYLLSNPLQNPQDIFSGLFSNIISINDKALVLQLIARAHLGKKTGVTKSTLEYLKDFGFSDTLIELFWRPFLTGVFLDPHLQQPADYFLFLMRCFSTGAVCLPEEGMQAVAKQIFSNLPAEQCHFNSAIHSASQDHVILENGKTIKADVVVLTADLSPLESGFHSVSNFYFTTQHKSSIGKWLLLCPQNQNFIINNVTSVSSVSPSYGSPQTQVLSVSTLNLQASQEMIQNELQELFPEYEDLIFEDKHVVKKALPIAIKNQGFEIRDGIFLTGDRYSSPSINGALRSGRLTAEAIAKSFNIHINS